jgi:acetyl esterase/lipase
MVAGLDPLRDEGLLYERVLREAGVATRLNVYVSLLHKLMVLTNGANQVPRPPAPIPLDVSANGGVDQM